MEFYYHELDPSVLLLSADGGLNADTSREFVGQLESLIDAGVDKIIVDCSRLDYISSYGVGMMLRLSKKLAARGGEVKFAGVKSKVLGVLSVMHMNDRFAMYPDVDQARLAFRPREDHPPLA